MPRSHTSRGLDRLVNFTDAAVAIAITLLVLPLIDLVTDDRTHTVRQLFTEEEGTFIAFASIVFIPFTTQLSTPSTSGR